MSPLKRFYLWLHYVRLHRERTRADVPRHKLIDRLANQVRAAHTEACRDCLDGCRRATLHANAENLLFRRTDTFWSAALALCHALIILRSVA
jgi:hypothetical protein